MLQLNKCFLQLFTFRTSRRQREMYRYSGHARLCVCVCIYLCVCLCVYLSLAAFPHYCTDLNVTWKDGRVPRSYALWAELQSVYGFRCYDNISPHILAVGAYDSIAANAKCQRVHACTRSMPGLVYCSSPHKKYATFIRRPPRSRQRLMFLRSALVGWLVGWLVYDLNF